ncbi:MAG: RICIN domain-containing protein [Oscillospiraceae bacterium]|nr:RICIN domain-containing protein [Oscillospiraceae bacterium]
MKTGKRLLAVILTLVLCIGMLPTTVFAASSFNTSSSSTIYYYVLKNVGTGKYLNVKGNSSANNTNITLWQKDGTSGQNFALYYDSTNKGYVIVPECSTARAVNIYGSSASNNLNVCTWTKTGHSTQAWILKAVSGGYIIQSANNTNYVLTASGSSNGSNICIQKYSSSNKNQVWTLSLQKTVKSSSSTIDTSKITTTMKNTYSSALSSFKNSSAGKGKTSFYGYCGACVSWQMKVLGITSGYEGHNGCDFYDSYKNTSTKTSGGYSKTAYSSSSKSMSSLLNSLNGKVSCTNGQYLMLGFQKGYQGNSYGHVILVYGVVNGNVYYTESFGSATNCKSISNFCSAYSGYTYEGAVLFSK